MRHLLPFLALVLLASTAHGASPSPPPVAPNSVVIVACKVDDLTGKPGRHGVDDQGNYHPELAAKDWKDYELHIKDGEYECKREVVANIVDQVAQQNPELPEMHPNFGVPSQCLFVSAFFVPDWELHHEGWAVVALGCPSALGVDDGTGHPKLDEHGMPLITGWQLPGCPDYLPGTENRMKCNFDNSAI